MILLLMVVHLDFFIFECENVVVVDILYNSYQFYSLGQSYVLLFLLKDSCIFLRKQKNDGATCGKHTLEVGEF